MISMRYHIISLAAVFLALALGIVVGATKISSPLLAGVTGERDSLTQERDDLRAENELLTARVAAVDGVGEAVAEVAVRGILPAAKVVLITTADADPADRDAVKSLLSKAGATVSAELDLTSEFTNPTRAADLRTLVASNLPAGQTLPVVENAGSQAGGLFALLLLNNAAGEPQARGPEMLAALGAFDGAGLLKYTEAPAAGDLVVILTGGENAGGSEGDRAKLIADMAAQMKVTAKGVVVSGRQGSESDLGAVGLVRSDSFASSTVSTVDNVDSGTGRLATVLALAEQNGGVTGRYGIAPSAQAAVPTLRAS